MNDGTSETGVFMVVRDYDDGGSRNIGLFERRQDAYEFAELMKARSTTSVLFRVERWEVETPKFNPANDKSHFSEVSGGERRIK